METTEEPTNGDDEAQEERNPTGLQTGEGESHLGRRMDPTAPRGYGEETPEEAEQHDQEVEEEAQSGLEEDEAPEAGDEP